MARPVLFEPSRGILTELTQLFDFVWPTAAAMWNLRWQVQGFIAVTPNVTNLDLHARFVQGSTIHGAGNLRGACIDKSWDDQAAQFAKFLLVDICALYESWVSQVLICLGSSKASIEKNLQFPTSIVNGRPNGIRAAIDDLTNPESSVMRLTFYDSLKSSPKNSLANLDNLLRCYRYFKECRNALIHHGGVASRQTIEAYLAFCSVATPAALDVSEVPMHQPPIPGAPIKLNLRGVVGLSNIVLRIVSTIDAELSRSVKAEQYLKNVWLSHHGRRYCLKTKSSDARSKQIHRLIVKLGLPKPNVTTEIEQWLRHHSLVS
ncbi:MAG: hypothetical protein LZF62_50371 [Nitrospira sp.]|nr:MAG: hypothetical protein LZF62_50371 [Nitrospira sp.]